MLPTTAPTRTARRTAVSRLLRGAVGLTVASLTVAGLTAAVPAEAEAATRCTTAATATSSRTSFPCWLLEAPRRGTGQVSESTTATATSVSLQPGQSLTRSSGTAFLDGSVSFTTVVGKLPTAGGLYLSGQLRSAGGKGYRPRVKVLTDGSLRLDLKQVVNGAEQSIGSEVVVPGKVAAGRSLSFEASVTGGGTPTVRSRAWLTGTAVPAWQLTRTHTGTTVVTTAGDSGLFAYLSSTSSAVPLSYAGPTGVAAAAPVAVAKPAPTPTPTPAPAPAPAPAPTPTPAPGAVRPDASNTGVPAGTALRVVHGDMEITTPGTVVDAVDLRGFLRIKAPNVTVKRSIIRGGPAVRVEGVVTVYPTATNFLITDSEVYPSQPSVKLDGIKGANFTARRVHVRGGVDNIKVHGSNVLIESSYLHDQHYYASDPLQNGGPTHNDAVQLLGGDNVRVVGNTLLSRKELNAAVQVTQDYMPVTRTVVSKNFVDGGGCSVNVNHKKLTELRNGISITDNTFGRTTRYGNCAVILSTKAYPALSGNRYTDGATVSPKYMAAT